MLQLCEDKTESEIGLGRNKWWRVKDLNLRRQSRGIYSPLPLAARATRQGLTFTAGARLPQFFSER